MDDRSSFDPQQAAEAAQSGPGDVGVVGPTGGPEGPSRWNTALREMMGGSVLITILAVFLGLVAGAVLIVITDENVATAAGYFFARPSDTFQAAWTAVSDSYVSLFQGSIYNPTVQSLEAAIRPITQTLTFATPLIAGGLGVGLAFRVGLFNIGGRGQMLVAAGCAGWVGFSLDLPYGLHLAVAVAAGLVGGAIWGGIVGLLKARTGAHEVIVTIMLNYVAFFLLSYLLRTPGALQAPGSNNPKSPPIKDTAVLPKLLGPHYQLHLGFILVIGATVLAWWILNRSNLGFQFRAVGENPAAARVAGINVPRMYVYAMLVSGGLVGLAGVIQVLGTSTAGFTSGIDSGIGFDAITVALLGRSKPWGIFAAGLLFGALKAGGYTMAAANGVPVDIVLVVQSLIVLFIAAPPLVRAIFRLPTPGARRPARRTRAKEVQAQ